MVSLKIKNQNCGFGFLGQDCFTLDSRLRGNDRKEEIGADTYY